MTSKMLHLQEIPSTNAYCKEHFGEMQDGEMVYTLNQTSGRGRLGRSWANAPEKALYLSQIIKRPLQSPECLPLAASLAVVDAIERIYDVIPLVKWPNDLLLNNKKIAGILCEGVQGGYVFGVGINLAQSQEFFDKNQLCNATSIFAATAEEPRNFCDLAFAINESLEHILTIFSQNGFEPLRGEYRLRCVNLLKQVHCGDISGKAIDIDENGRLVVLTKDGEKSVFTGEVSVEGIYSNLT